MSSPGSHRAWTKPANCSARSPHCRGPAFRLCSRSNMVFIEKQSFLPLSQCLWTEVNYSILVAGPLSLPRFVLLCFLTRLSFLSESLRVSCSQTGFICHSINQDSLLMPCLHPCNGMVIYGHRVAWTCLGFLQGLIKGGLNRPRYTGGFPDQWQVISSCPERDLSASIIKKQRERGPRRHERSLGSMSQAPAGPRFASLFFFFFLSSSPQTQTPLSKGGM